MPRKKATLDVPEQVEEPRLLRKRSHQELEAIPESDLETTPTKRQRSGRYSPPADDTESDSHAQSTPLEVTEDPIIAVAESPVKEDDTPKPKRRGRPPKAKPPVNGDTPTPKASRIANFTTPTKRLNGSTGLTPMRQAADQSAKRKSARAFIQHVVGDELTDDEDNGDFARRIIDSSDEDEDEDIEGDGVTTAETSAVDEAATPSKKTPRPRGRPRKVRSPTPPRDLPPHEQYFAQNKPGRPKTSNNTLGSLAMLTHDEYFTIVKENQDRHAADIEYLESLHAESFPQWTFEISQGFGVCLYGFGSKKKLLHKFATHLYSRRRVDRGDKIVMINGYAHTTTMREILSSVGSAIDPTQRIPLAQPPTMVQSILTQLAGASDMILTLVVNSIDAAPLRKPGYHAALAQLAAHPRVRLVCSADTPDFALLWDIGVRSAFNFAFHDCTTFAPYAVELDVVDDVHELLGRNAHRVNGREGVAFVLRSLPENAKNLFRLLVAEALFAMEEEGGDEVTGVEYRMVYNKAVEEFICSSEMAFRTLLKEFHDHQIITSMKDAIGTELLSLPFRRDELEAIFEDLTS
ncbi:origin recognition complex subunit 2-domain-containing protein [Dactylonectria macrodidyma]|uniref:Origin recognition complex subunit 2 n=1 Tax=Dactylonectria macrodidyma TaxID=307937 RepID=A0A9P9JMT7_9HYPO|nr:origin recognition complex subunit 2-domain-containing protein [Dactylonectria macrodidyma]